MSRDENKDVIRKLVEAANAGDFESIERCFRSDYVDHTTGGSREGAHSSEAMAAFRDIATAFPDSHHELLLLIAEGDLVVARISASGTQSAPFRGTMGTGGTVNMVTTAIYRIESGQIAERWCDGATAITDQLAERGEGSTRDGQPEGPIRWRMHLPVPPATVFAAFDSDDGRASFWAESAVETEGRIHFQFVNGESYQGEILRREPPCVWGVEYFGGEARFEFAPDGTGGTDLRLHHDGVGRTEWREVHTGWLNVLFPLKAAVVHGVDLRNHDPRRTWDHGYADQ